MGLNLFRCCPPGDEDPRGVTSYLLTNSISREPSSNVVRYGCIHAIFTGKKVLQVVSNGKKRDGVIMGDTVASWRAVFCMSCPEIGPPLYPVQGIFRYLQKQVFIVSY
jgi:hypothetical protein